jgi:hypothetical protein
LFDVAVPSFFLIQGFFLAGVVPTGAPSLGPGVSGQGLMRWAGRMAAMYGLWSLPLLFLQRGQGAAALAWQFASVGLGPLWYLLAAVTAAPLLWCAGRWLPRQHWPLVVMLVLVLGEALALGRALGVWPEWPACDPADAGLWRNVLFTAVPCLLLGAWWADRTGFAGLRPHEPSLGACCHSAAAPRSRAERLAGRVLAYRAWPWLLLVLGGGLVLLEVGLTHASGLQGGWFSRHLLLGHPLVALGLLGLGLRGDGQPAGQRWASRFWALAPNLVFLAHLPMLALIYKLGVLGGFELPPRQMALAILLACLVLTVLLLPVQRRWHWVA